MNRVVLVLASIVLALSPGVALSSPSPIPPAGAIALVKATPQLSIDPTTPQSDAYPANTSPWVNVSKGDSGASGGYLLASFAHQGTVGGLHVLVIPLASGGTGDVFTQIVFAGPTPSQVKYLGYLTSEGHLDVQVTGGAIVAKYPRYAPDDAQCCPKKYAVETYDIAGGKLNRLTSTVVPASSQ